MINGVEYAMGTPSWERVREGGRQSPLLNVPHRDVFYRRFRYAETHLTIGRLYALGEDGRDAIELIYEAIRLGLHGPEGTASAATISRPIVRLALPFLPPKKGIGTWDIRKPDHRQQVREFLFPILLKRSELRDPKRHDELRNAFYRARREAAAPPPPEPVAAPQPVTPEPARAAPPAAESEYEVVAFGTMLWPPSGGEESAPYDLPELLDATEYADTLVKSIDPNHEPYDVRRIGMNMARALGRLDAAVEAVLDAYFANPTGGITYTRRSTTNLHPGWRWREDLVRRQRT